MSKRKKRSEIDLRRFADQQLVNFRRKADQLLKRELKVFRERFATKAELKKEVKRLDQSDEDQAETFRAVLNQIDDRFDVLENAS